MYIALFLSVTAFYLLVSFKVNIFVDNNDSTVKRPFVENSELLDKQRKIKIIKSAENATIYHKLDLKI